MLVKEEKKAVGNIEKKLRWGHNKELLSTGLCGRMRTTHHVQARQIIPLQLFFARRTQVPGRGNGGRLTQPSTLKSDAPFP